MIANLELHQQLTTLYSSSHDPAIKERLAHQIIENGGHDPRPKPSTPPPPPAPPVPPAPKPDDKSKSTAEKKSEEKPAPAPETK